VIGDGLERELAFHFEHVPDVVEDPREVAVRQSAGGLVLVVGAQVGVGDVDVRIIDESGLTMISADSLAEAAEKVVAAAKSSRAAA